MRSFLFYSFQSCVPQYTAIITIAGLIIITRIILLILFFVHVQQCSIDLYDCLNLGEKGKFECLKDYMKPACPC